MAWQPGRQPGLPVKFLIASQMAVLDWWRSKVTPHGGPKSRDRGMLVAEAESIIGFSDSKISRWRTSLAKPEQYEDRLHQAARRKAGG